MTFTCFAGAAVLCHEVKQRPTDQVNLQTRICQHPSSQPHKLTINRPYFDHILIIHLGRTSNTTLQILSVRGVPPPPFTDFFSGKKGFSDLGGSPPPFTDFPPKIFLKKGLKMVFFAQKTPNFGPKNRLRIWGVPPSPPLRISHRKFFFKKG